MNFYPLIAIISLAGVANAQQLLNSPGNELHLRPTDAEIFDAGSSRSELPCIVSPIRPVLDFDFLFHSGFQLSLSFKELEMGILGNDLTIMFRVIPKDRTANAVYMFQRHHIPARNDWEKGTVELAGYFRLGEGKYHVDWMMRDSGEHVCTSSWDIEARLAPKETPMRGWVVAGLIKPMETDVFSDEVPIGHSTDFMKVDLLVNFGPHDPSSAILDTYEVQTILAILRQISRDPNIGSYSLLACSVLGRQVLQRPAVAPRIDFPALGRSLQALRLGVVDAKDLGAKDLSANPNTGFATDMLRTLSLNSDSDALILVGPRMLAESTSARELAELFKDIGRPVFYFSYVSGAVLNPWRDNLGNAVKQAHGVEYEITNPRDFFTGWSDAMNRILKLKRMAKSTGLSRF